MSLSLSHLYKAYLDVGRRHPEGRAEDRFRNYPSYDDALNIAMEELLSVLTLDDCQLLDKERRAK